MNVDPLENMCRKKVRYSTEMNAAAGIGRTKFLHPEMKDVYMRVYPCPNCRGFHITTREFDGYAKKMRIMYEHSR